MPQAACRPDTLGKRLATREDTIITMASAQAPNHCIPAVGNTHTTTKVGWGERDISDGWFLHRFPLLGVEGVVNDHAANITSQAACRLNTLGQRLATGEDSAIAIVPDHRVPLGWDIIMRLKV